MNLLNCFDAVIMLTWSDWKNEPRSNRYHFATRFSKQLPVLFVQHLYSTYENISVETSEIENMDIVYIGCDSNEKNIEDFKLLLRTRGIKRPLFWIYDSLHYGSLIEAYPNAFRVYHATEDYLTETNAWSQNFEILSRSVKQLLPKIDFMVACTDKVAESYLSKGEYNGPFIVSKNGCDAEFFIEESEHYVQNKSHHEKPIAIFQGGINQRLDYELINELVTNMPDWQFHFCGTAIESEGWNKVLEKKNVCYLGKLSAEEIAQQMCESTVGIIPFIQDDWIRNSLPLKAYEYVACGLPVITVPITALEHESALMKTATTANEFAAVIRQVSASRHDPEFLAHCRKIALANSYEKRFSTVMKNLVEEYETLRNTHKHLNIAVLYDGMFSMHVNTVREHLESFEKYSRNSITYITATPQYWNCASHETKDLVDFSFFDVVILHYSTRLSVIGHLDEGIALAVQKYNGLKVLFIQDEYESTEVARTWIDRLRFDVIYTCVPCDGLQYVYPDYRYPAIEFLPTLTGYVPEDTTLDYYAKSMSDRELLIAYRGRKLPEVYGELGYEKYQIGKEVKEVAEERGFAVDIEVDDAKRIYGLAWYEFLGSARATLGTESGASVFDINGSLRKEIDDLKINNPSIDFEEVSAKVLSCHEGLVSMNQISPKIFEAIRLRTALVLYEGTYSGVIKANKHYIPLKKDLSNIDDVLEKLQDTDYLEKLTDRAYQDVVASGKFSYRSFVEKFDAYIQGRVLRSNNQTLLTGPLFILNEDGNLKQALPSLPLGLSSGPHPLGKPMHLSELTELHSGINSLLTELHSGANSLLTELHSGTSFLLIVKYFRLYCISAVRRAARNIWKRLPLIIKVRLLAWGRFVKALFSSQRQKQTFLFRTTRSVWRVLPFWLRTRLVKLLGRIKRTSGVI